MIPRADGIVVLTGGTARIDGALALLAEGRAERLLISGVNPAVGRDAIAEMVPADLRPALDCCVDLDHARDTIENATSTGAWTTEQGFSSLIVVTSDYHMPRSMAELADAMPGVRLIAFPVSSPDLDLRRWWRDPVVFNLLIREYSKYLVAEAPPAPPLAGGQRTRPASDSATDVITAIRSALFTAAFFTATALMAIAGIPVFLFFSQRRQ